MKRRMALIAAWLAVTTLATAVSVGAVALVGRGVTNRPDVTVLAGDGVGSEPAVATSQPTTVLSTAPPVPTAPTSTTSVPSTPTTTSDTPVTTASPPTTGPPPAATTPPATAVAVPFSFVAPGGVVTISCLGDDVRFDGAVPTLGYTAEVEESGPARVRVEFRNSQREDEIRVECAGGVPDADVRVG